MLNVATLTHEPTDESIIKGEELAHKRILMTQLYEKHTNELERHRLTLKKNARRSLNQLQITKKQPWYYWLLGHEKDISAEDIGYLSRELSNISYNPVFDRDDSKALPLDEVEFPGDKAKANKLALMLINRDIYVFRKRSKQSVGYFKSEINKLVSPQDNYYDELSEEKDRLIGRFELYAKSAASSYKSLPALYVVARHHRLPTPY